MTLDTGVSTMTPTHHVLMALTGGMLIFLVAGGRVDKLTAKLRNQPYHGELRGIDAPTLVGWGGLLVILVFASDVDTTAPLAVGFAWLIFLSIVMAYGTEAAQRLIDLMGGATPTTSTAAKVRGGK